MKTRDVIFYGLPFLFLYIGGIRVSTNDGFDFFKIYVPTWLRRILFIVETPSKISILVLVWQIYMVTCIILPIVLFITKGFCQKYNQIYNLILEGFFFFTDNIGRFVLGWSIILILDCIIYELIKKYRE